MLAAALEDARSGESSVDKSVSNLLRDVWKRVDISQNIVDKAGKTF